MDEMNVYQNVEELVEEAAEAAVEAGIDYRKVGEYGLVALGGYVGGKLLEKGTKYVYKKVVKPTIDKYKIKKGKVADAESTECEQNDEKPNN